MNERQIWAVDACLYDLSAVLPVGPFLRYLVRRNVLRKSEMKLMLEENSLNPQKGHFHGHFIMFGVLKHKNGGWDCLIAYLNRNKLGILADKLFSLATEKLTDNHNVIINCDNNDGAAVTKSHLFDVALLASWIDFCVESIEWVLQLICDRETLASKSTRSAINMLRNVVIYADDHQKRRITKKFIVEKLCQSVRLHMCHTITTEHLEIVKCGWICLTWICDSYERKKRFLDTGGSTLLYQCCTKFSDDISLVWNMTLFMLSLSFEQSLRQRLVTTETMAMLWKLSKDKFLTNSCQHILANLASDPSGSSHLGYPALTALKRKLK